MTDALVPPPEFAHLRWHWLAAEVGEPFVAQWEQSNVASGWRNFAGWSGSKAMAGCGVRYHAPCDPGAAATIERLTVALRQLLAEFDKFSRYGSPIAGSANEACAAAKQALGDET